MELGWNLLDGSQVVSSWLPWSGRGRGEDAECFSHFQKVIL